MGNRIQFLLWLCIIANYSCNSPVQKHTTVRTSGNHVQNDSASTWLQKQDTELAKLAKDMQEQVDVNADTDDNSHEDSLTKRMLVVLANKASFTYNFSKLKAQGVNLVTSADGKLKVYFWQSPSLSTMWHIQNILQYTTGKQVLTSLFDSLYDQKDNDGPSPFISKIYHLNQGEPQQYLLLCNGQMSGTEPYQAAHLLNIVNGRFAFNKKAFYIKSKPVDEVYASATILDGQDADSVKRALQINYDSVKKVITYPGTVETSHGTALTGRTYQLHYNAGVFK